MDTATFLRHVLPSTGHYFLAIPIAGGGYRHTAFTDATKMAGVALRASGQGVNTFFALAGYEQPEYVGADGKKHWRTQDNVVAARCFWMDIDCGEQYHGSQKEGAADMARFCTEADLPTPNFIVNSGNGLHIYWLMDRDIPKAQWRRVAMIIRDLAQKLNFAQDDTSRTSDIASVLRPIGTVNDKTHKGLGIKNVKLLRADTDPVDFCAFVRSIADARVKFGVTGRVDKPTVDLNSDLTGSVEYPPASAVTIALHCNQMRLFSEFKGAGQSEPVWRGCLGIVKHCIEGDELAHEWSSGYSGYDKRETQIKLDNWKTPPPLCTLFQGLNAAGCAGCKHKCKTPMQLGQIAPVSVEEIVHIDETEESGVKLEPIPALPPSLKRKFTFNAEQGLTAKTESDEGVAGWTEVCSSMIFPSGYYCDKEDDFKWKLTLQVRTKPYTWISAEIDAKAIGQGGAILTGELANKSMVVTRHPKLLEDYMKTWLEEMKSGQDEIAMHSYMGWQPDGSFVTGDMRYFPDGTHRQIILTSELRQMVNRLKFNPVGDKHRYSELLNTAYNRPYHEAYQFMYLAGFGSTLVSLLESGPVGILVSGWSSDTGLGKSTVCKLAGGIWHDPSEVVDADGTTPHALTLNAGLRRNLPLVVDELTQWAPERSAGFAYRYSSGKSREQGAASGGLRDNSHLNWGNMGLCNGNKSQHENIKMYNQECQAQLARVFEYEFKTTHEQTMTSEEGRVVLDELMRMRAVWSGDFAEYLAVNQDSIKTRLIATYNKFITAAGLSKDARFWVIGCACVWVAYEITKELGVQKFEAPALIRWVVDQLKAHDAGAKSSTVNYLSLFSDACNVLQSGFIVTTDRGGKHHNARMAPGWSMPKSTVTGRVVIDEARMSLSVTSLTNWCRENKVDKSQMVAELKRVGWLTNITNARLGTGTHLAAPVGRVYEFDWSRFDERVRLTSETAPLMEVTP